MAAGDPEPWGLANGLEVADDLGLTERVMSFRYGAVEGEPSFPLTNYTPDRVVEATQGKAPRGVMANAQAHCLQLPNTLAFARAAWGLPVDDAAFAGFAEELVPDQGARVLEAWKVLAGTDAEAMDQAAASLVGSEPWISAGPLSGLLFGDPERFRVDLFLQLRFRAAFARLDQATMQGMEPRPALVAAVEALTAWQERHGYRNAWNRPELEAPLRRLADPRIDAALDQVSYLGEGDTPLARIQDGYRQVETFGPRLLAALQAHLAAGKGS